MPKRTPEGGNPEEQPIPWSEPGEEGLVEALPVPSEYAHPDQEVPPVSAEPRRYPSTVGGAIYLLVLAAALVGIGVTMAGAWRTGATWLGVGLIVAAVARWVLPEDSAGMLKVRRKLVDVPMVLAFGTLIVLLAWTIPDQPPLP